MKKLYGTGAFDATSARILQVCFILGIKPVKPEGARDYVFTQKQKQRIEEYLKKVGTGEE